MKNIKAISVCMVSLLAFYILTAITIVEITESEITLALKNSGFYETEKGTFISDGWDTEKFESELRKYVDYGYLVGTPDRIVRTGIWPFKKTIYIKIDSSDPSIHHYPQLKPQTRDEKKWTKIEIIKDVQQ